MDPPPPERQLHRRASAGLDGRPDSASSEVRRQREQVHSEDSLSKLTAHIKTRDADWMVRDGALQRLGILLQDGALDPGDLDFGKQLKAVVGALCAQLPDNRSQLIKNACSTIVAFVEVLGDHPAMDRPLREQVFPLPGENLDAV